MPDRFLTHPAFSSCKGHISFRFPWHMPFFVTLPLCLVSPFHLNRFRIYRQHRHSKPLNTTLKLKAYCLLFFGGGNMTEVSRPLDTLNRARDKRVIVELKSQKQLIGTLKSFDIHINVVLDNADEMAEGEVKRKLGTVFLRGDTIILISPEK